MSHNGFKTFVAAAVGLAVGYWAGTSRQRRGRSDEGRRGRGGDFAQWSSPATQPVTSGSLPDPVAPQAQATKAWLLVISSKFTSVGDRDSFLSHVRRVAQQSACHEPATLGFQVGIADTDPLRLLIFERFASKDAWQDPHRGSAAFKELKAWQMASGIQVETQGQSYNESDIGYLTPSERGYVIQHSGEDILR